MTDRTEKAIEAAYEILEPHFLSATGDVATDLIRRAIAAYEAAMWMDPKDAPPNTDMLIAGGTVRYTEMTFPDDEPFGGVSIGRVRYGGEWHGGYGREFDGEYIHNPSKVRPLPSLPENEK